MELLAMIAGALAGMLGILVAALLAHVLTVLVYGKRARAGRRVGGLLHWRIGRLGGSFYLRRAA